MTRLRLCRNTGDRYNLQRTLDSMASSCWPKGWSLISPSRQRVSSLTFMSQPAAMYSSSFSIREVNHPNICNCHSSLTKTHRRANKRTDSYGGSVENRCRLTLEVFDAISQVFGGPELVCVKLCPCDILNDSVTTFEEMQDTYMYLLKELVSRRVGIINLTRRGADHAANDVPRPEGYPIPRGYDPVLDLGRLVKYPGSPTLLMANQDYTVEEADALIRGDKLDLITFGRPFIYNPVSSPFRPWPSLWR